MAIKVTYIVTQAQLNRIHLLCQLCTDRQRAAEIMETVDEFARHEEGPIGELIAADEARQASKG